MVLPKYFSKGFSGKNIFMEMSTIQYEIELSIMCFNINDFKCNE